MSNLSKLTDWFNSQVGTREKGENNVIYNTHYYGGEVNGPQYPWCCAFIWDGFRVNGLSNLFCGGEKTAYCPYVVNWAQSHGRWVTGDYRAGDLLLYDWDGDRVADHIGFVVSWNGASGVVIEGNASDAVSRLNRNLSSVLGAYRPDYGDDERQPIPVFPESVQPAQPTENQNPGVYVVESGDSLWSIAEKFLGNGFLFGQIRDANHLDSDLIHPGQQLVIPGGNTTSIQLTLKTEVANWLTQKANERGLTVAQLIEEAFNA